MICPDSDYEICSDCVDTYDPQTKSCVDEPSADDNKDDDGACANNTDAAACGKCGEYFYSNKTSVCTPCSKADSFSECFICLEKDLSIK